MIVYFSGTGNSRYCARFLAQRLGDTAEDATPYLRSGGAAHLTAAQPWVFVCPTYAWRIPRVFRDFLRRSSFSGGKDAYFVMTCGSETGDAQRELPALCAALGLTYRGLFPVAMPDNYLVLFQTPAPEAARESLATVRPRLEEAARLTGVSRSMLAQIEKAYGKGAIMRLGDDIPVNVEAISTGSLSLDLALGIGGVPRGRIVEIYGPESCGKTTLALHVVASAQKEGGEAAYIDVEHALEPAYARALGVDIDNLLISQPDTGEQALEITEALVRSNAIDVIVVDSVAALVPRAEIEGEMGDSHVGLQARLMSQAMRKLTSVIGKTNTVCVFINQLREKVGVMYGNPEVTTGGRALKYYASVRIDVRRVEGLKDSSGQFIGNHTRAKVVKNKVAPPFRQAEFDIMFGQGIAKTGELIDLGVQLDLVQKSGSWFAMGETRLGQGRDNAKQFLADNPEIANDIEGQIRANADKLYSTGRRGALAKGSAAVAAQEEAKDKEAAKSAGPVVKAPAPSSESELDIMVED